MKVKELKEKIKDVPDDYAVIFSSEINFVEATEAFSSIAYPSKILADLYPQSFSDKKEYFGTEFEIGDYSEDKKWIDKYGFNALVIR